MDTCLRDDSFITDTGYNVDVDQGYKWIQLVSGLRVWGVNVALQWHCRSTNAAAILSSVVTLLRWDVAPVDDTWSVELIWRCTTVSARWIAVQFTAARSLVWPLIYDVTDWLTEWMESTEYRNAHLGRRLPVYDVHVLYPLHADWLSVQLLTAPPAAAADDDEDAREGAWWCETVPVWMSESLCVSHPLSRRRWRHSHCSAASQSPWPRDHNAATGYWLDVSWRYLRMTRIIIHS